MLPVMEEYENQSGTFLAEGPYCAIPEFLKLLSPSAGARMFSCREDEYRVSVLVVKQNMKRCP